MCSTTTRSQLDRVAGSSYYLYRGMCYLQLIYFHYHKYRFGLYRRRPPRAGTRCQWTLWSILVAHLGSNGNWIRCRWASSPDDGSIVRCQWHHSSRSFSIPLQIAFSYILFILDFYLCFISMPLPLHEGEFFFFFIKIHQERHKWNGEYLRHE